MGSAIFNTLQAVEWRTFVWCWCLIGSVIGDFILIAVMKKQAMSNHVNEVEVTENGVIANFANGGQILINWLKVASVKTYGSDLVIKTSSMPQLNIVIPQRAVGTKTELELLRTQIDTFWSDWLLNGSKCRLQTDSIKQSGLSVESNNTFRDVLAYIFVHASGNYLLV